MTDQSKHQKILEKWIKRVKYTKKPLIQTENSIEDYIIFFIVFQNRKEQEKNLPISYNFDFLDLTKISQMHQQFGSKSIKFFKKF